MAHCKQGNGLIKVNGKPLYLVQPATLRYKVPSIKGSTLFHCIYHVQLEEPLLLLGRERFEGVDIRVRVRGGGQVSQVYGKIYNYSNYHAIF